jgi:hypothetical protein
MSTTYGSTPGVRVETRGTSIVGIEVGEAQKVVIFGRGDPQAGAASVNDPTQVASQSAADTQFGEDTPLANALRDALGNGANPGFLYGVMPEAVDVSAESVAGGSGTLSETPVVEAPQSITVTNTTAGVEESVTFRYESPPQTGTLGSGEVALNPFTGEVEAGDSDAYEIDYRYLEWADAFDSADGVLLERETGVYVALTEAESIASTLSSKVNALRDPDFKLVRGIAAAEPNATANDGAPAIETAAYSDSLDNDSQFLLGNARQDGSVETVLGGAAGRFGGNALTNPVFGETLTNVTAAQRLTTADRSNLRQRGVIPIRAEGAVEINGNTSTSTETDFLRDFFTRRVVDQSILVVKQVGDSILDRINNETTRDIAAQEAQAALEQLAADGLLEPNTADETNLAVSAREVDATTVGLEAKITPEGVTKSVDATVLIDTN